MLPSRILFSGALVLATAAGCSADDAIDDVTAQVEDVADDALADQVSRVIQDNTSLAAPDADCVADELIAALGTGTVIELLVETRGDVDRLDEADRERLEAAVRDAGAACDVDASDLAG